MDQLEEHTSRRSFLTHVAGMGVVVALGPLPLQADPKWDVSWLETVRKAKHRVVFDAPTPGAVLDLAARWYDNLDKAYGKSAGRACAVLNLRTRSTYMGLADPMWQKYPVGEDAKVTDPETNTPARRNLELRVSEEKTAMGYGSIEHLQSLGAIVIVCDFALGHLANRLAKATSAKGEDVHTELRANLVRGAYLVPSGIFGAAESQNAGCAFMPAP
ncbi:MAG TPA: twin-arginine translocation signal domain-containing protein [Gemmatimonadaceae bacterium]